MKHNIRQRKLNRTTAHRKALLMNLSNALLKHEQIITTLPKAKELRPFVEKLITLGKRGSLNQKKDLIAQLQDKSSVKKLCENTPNENVIKLNNFVDVEGENSIDNLLKNNNFNK